MEKYVILANPEARTFRGARVARRTAEKLKGECRIIDSTAKEFSFRSFLEETDPEEKIVFTGGDGTLSHIVNRMITGPLERDIYFYPGGSGNDFIRDLDLPVGHAPVLLNPYIENLPVVETGGHTFRFVNGVGVGLDGYCCEEKLRLKQKGKVRSYTAIALGALFGRYTPCDAEITVDGETHKYGRVWMAPAMFGRYFGGGVMAAPKQDRTAPEHTLTSVCVHDAGRLMALVMFLLFCKGKGFMFPRHIEFRTGCDITVKLSEPNAIQFDGETLSNMTEYRAYSKRL